MKYLRVFAASDRDIAKSIRHRLRTWCMACALVLSGSLHQTAHAYGWDSPPNATQAWFWAAYFCPSATAVESCATCLAERFGVTSEVKVDNAYPPDDPYHYSCYYKDWNGVSWIYANNTVKGPYCPPSTYLSEDRLHCNCPLGQQWFNDVSLCVSVTKLPATTAPPNHPSNNGGTCPTDPGGRQPQCGEPINPGTGNMWHTEHDYASASPLSGLTISRTYNSSPYSWDADVSRSFGKRWTHRYDAILKAETPYLAGASPATCWRREDTSFTWCTTDVVVLQALPNAVSIVRGNGKKSLFNRSSLGWVGDANNNDRLTALYDAGNSTVLEWILISASGDEIERFDRNGRLLSISTRSGSMQRLTYGNGQTNDTSLGRLPADAPICTHIQPGAVVAEGKLLCVTDSAGRQLNFEYGGAGISKIIDPEHQAYLFEYDGLSAGCLASDIANPACSASNLTKVTYPNGQSRTYFYNEAIQINDGANCPHEVVIGNGFGGLLNAMTGLVDENNSRHISWTYDCLGRAITSQHAGGADKVTLSYGAYDSNGSGTTTVTHYTGDPLAPQTTTRQYSYRMILGQAKNGAIDQPCVECGNAKTRSYDPSGNLATRTDWNGTKTCFSYDTTRNLETVRMEGTPEATACGNSLAATTLAAPIRKISTQWHASYRLPTAIAEPYKRTTFSYDDKGNLLARTEHATTDSTGIQAFNATTTGGTHTWRYTYNDIGQVLTATDPLGAITAYTYDEFGNLATVTDTAGQVTTLSHYDANGHVGKIVDPNSIVTTLTYSPRGWLVTKTTGDDTTLYDYDGVGQLTTVTLPDGSSLYYSYDDAHRLTTMADSHGNRIAYTLDLRGNRMAEHITDPDGTLTRQTSRVYDALSRLQQATGAGQ